MNEATLPRRIVTAITLPHLRIEERITALLLVLSFILNGVFGVSFFANAGEYVYFFLAMLLPVFLGTTLLFFLIQRKITRASSSPYTKENIAAIARILIVLFIGFYAYSHLKVLIPLINPANHDAILFRLDKWLFLGHSPTLEILKIKGLWFSKLMYLSYTSFYAAFPASFAAAFISKDTFEMRKLVYGILIIYFFGIALYYLVPSLGPLFYTPWMFEHIPNVWQKVLWSGHMAVQTNTAAFRPAPFLGVAAFPSLHAAHFLFLAIIAARHHRWLFYIYIPWTILLYTSTVYMGWHYVTDLIAGVLMALAAAKIISGSLDNNQRILREASPSL